MKINEQNKVATKCRVDPFAAVMENVIHLHTFAFALILEERVASWRINWNMLLGMFVACVLCCVFTLYCVCTIYLLYLLLYCILTL